MQIACIGVGTIGRGWACAFLAAGHRVSLVDTMAEVLREAQDSIHRTLAILHEAGRFGSVTDAMARLNITSELGVALTDVSYVQESIVEDVAAKRELFRRLDQLCSAQVVIGSSTSAIPGSAFMGELGISARCIVVHPTNPPYLVPLVELCATPWTAESTVAMVEDLMKQVGQTPVRIRRELTGYALNRLQAAVVGEALHLVAEGFISAQDLDKVMTNGLGFRWAVAGPFLTGHLNAPNGYHDYMTRYGHIYRELIRNLRVDYAWTDAHIAMADEMIRRCSGGCSIDELQGWRDRALATLRPMLRKLEAVKPGQT